MVAENSVSQDTLREVDLFHSLSRPQISRLLSGTRRSSIHIGQRLFNHGDRARSFYHLQSGQLKLVRTARNGAEKVVDIVAPGTTFAQDSMFINSNVGYPVSAIAIEASDVLSFDIVTVRQLLSESYEVCLRLLTDLSVQVRSQLEEIEHLTLHDASCRLADFLIQQLPTRILESSEIQLTTPKSVIASRLGIQAETFSRIMRRFEESGLISVTGQTVVLIDPDGLRSLIDY
jgi:CRP-like cAMP-binding protein